MGERICGMNGLFVRIECGYYFIYFAKKNNEEQLMDLGFRIFGCGLRPKKTSGS